MHQLIFVNLPVADLARSRAFFGGLGYTFNEDFCDERGLCLELGPTLHAMLLTQDFFARFHDGRTAGPGTVETLLCLSADSRGAVDSIVDRAVALGGADVRTEDEGFMYGRSYSDPDGHIWEILWMEPVTPGGGPEGPTGATVDVGPGRGERR
ncbi:MULTISPECIES: VOC family protein [unclassified Ornithinimicrobium]|uniref:VOC family protein n=1 Tax=unclassified Ornithinimicrobium TaxID=2615080 RepID=UPI0038529C30